MTSSHIGRRLGHWFSALAAALDPRSAPRLARLLLGAVLARGRRTVTCWIRAAGLSSEFRPCYTSVSAAGQRADSVAGRLCHEVIRPILGGRDRLVLGIDDTPTQRYGPLVQGAGVHHNPCPGPARCPFVYGHVWVVLALLAAHPHWGVIALPLLARLYVRRKDLGGIDAPHRPAFATKLELAAGLLRWAKGWLGSLGQPLWVVADGAYAKAAFLKPVKTLGVVVVSRLRKDAALRTVPTPRSGRRGRPRKYGESRIVLARRAGQRRGWQTGAFALYGEPVVKRYKTFLATWRPAGGVIRVVLVDEPRGWIAFFCTEAKVSVADILGLVADRFSLETAFRDLKEVVGAGQQQVRHLWASVGSFHLCLWAFTLTEAWAWDRGEGELSGHRRESPWDDQPRRPSHADKRRAWRRELLTQEIDAVLRDRADGQEIRDLAECLLNLVA
jgi:hypothetical protein